jgi:hypothetical protein
MARGSAQFWLDREFELCTCSFTPQNGSNPSSTYARYIYTTLENGQLRVNISHQDYYFRPLSARNRTTGAYERFQPAFVCSVRCHSRPLPV